LGKYKDEKVVASHVFPVSPVEIFYVGSRTNRYDGTLFILSVVESHGHVAMLT
jgi:hypothetical protein